MGKDYITRTGIIQPATATYTALTGAMDGSTPGSVKVPQGRNRITKVIASFAIEGALGTAEVGNIGVVRLSGKGMLTGDQELLVGGVSTEEVGTSTTIVRAQKRATVINTSIGVSGGNEITVSGSYSGTDIGDQLVTVTLEFSTGSGPMANYYTRLDSATQGTTTYTAVETTPDGATSAIVTEKTARRISQVIFGVVMNAAHLISGAQFAVKLSGTGMTEQEIVMAATQGEDGGGTIGATFFNFSDVQILPVDIDITGGNTLTLACAYKGTDVGTPFVAITVEVF